MRSRLLHLLQQFLTITRLRWLSQRISSALYWGKVGWGTYDWDSNYGLKLLRLYCNRLYKNIEKYSQHVKKDQDLRRIKEFSYILKRLVEDDYTRSIYKPRYIDLLGEWEPHPTNPKLIGKYIPLTSKLTKELKDTMFLTEKERIAYGDAQRKQDCQYVGQYLEKYFDKWWD